MLYFIAVFFAGILSFLSPCVLPIVPPFLCYIAGVDAEILASEEHLSDKKLRLHILKVALCFCFGFSLIFIFLGAGASFIGSWLREYSEILSKIAGIVILLMSLHFLGIFRIKLFYSEFRFLPSISEGSLFGAFGIGMAFAFGWTPCIGPVLAGILVVAGSKETILQGIVLLSIYSAGLAIPFLISAFALSFFLKFFIKFRGSMIWIEKIMGLLLLLTSIAFLVGSFQQAGLFLQTTFL